MPTFSNPLCAVGDVISWMPWLLFLRIRKNTRRDSIISPPITPPTAPPMAAPREECTCAGPSDAAGGDVFAVDAEEDVPDVVLVRVADGVLESFVVVEGLTEGNLVVLVLVCCVEVGKGVEDLTIIVIVVVAARWLDSSGILLFATSNLRAKV